MNFLPLALIVMLLMTAPASAQPAAGQDHWLDDDTVAAEQLKHAISMWAGAWQAQLPDVLLSFYVPDYVGPGYTSREAWIADRRDRILAPESISLRLIDFELVALEAGQATTRFTLVYERPGYADETWKELVLEEHGGKWLIIQEDNLRVSRK